LEFFQTFGGTADGLGGIVETDSDFNGSADAFSAFRRSFSISCGKRVCAMMTLSVFRRRHTSLPLMRNRAKYVPDGT